MAHTRFTSAVVLSFSVLLAACIGERPTEPTLAQGSLAVSARGGIPGPNRDVQLAELSREVPGFAGIYRDDAGQVRVRVARGITTASDEDVVRGVADGLRARGYEMPDGAVVVEDAEHDYAQLYRWHEQLGAVLSLEGTVFTDLDERTGRLMVAVEAGADHAAVRNALEATGVPSDLVDVETAEAIETDDTLRQRHRAVGGGLQINFVRGTSGFLCTLGFNILRDSPGRSTQYFVTNSHCSDTRGEVLNTPYWQHSRAVDETFIGYEFMDPPYWTGAPCSAGRRCRFSDALIARYDHGDGAAVRFGVVYRTEDIGSLEVPEEDKYIRIAGERPFPLVGDILHKVGRTSGWTVGPVTATCINSNVANSDIQMRCQDRVATVSAGGDSGSPYFYYENGQAILVGIHWGSGGGTTVLSAMQNIRAELGSFRTH